MRNYVNFYVGGLSLSATSSDTTIYLPQQLMPIDAGNHIVLSLKNAAGDKREIVHATSHDETGTTVVERAKEGTTAQDWLASDCIVLASNTAGIMSDIESIVNTSPVDITGVDGQSFNIDLTKRLFSVDGANNVVLNIVNEPTTGHREWDIYFNVSAMSDYFSLRRGESLIAGDGFIWEDGQPPCLGNSGWLPTIYRNIGDNLIIAGTGYTRLWQCTTGGVSGETHPTFPVSPAGNATVSDGEVVWTFQDAAIELDSLSRILFHIKLTKTPLSEKLLGSWKSFKEKTLIAGCWDC